MALQKMGNGGLASGGTLDSGAKLGPGQVMVGKGGCSYFSAGGSRPSLSLYFLG